MLPSEFLYSKSSEFVTSFLSPGCNPEQHIVRILKILLSKYSKTEDFFIEIFLGTTWTSKNFPSLKDHRIIDRFNSDVAFIEVEILILLPVLATQVLKDVSDIIVHYKFQEPVNTYVLEMDFLEKNISMSK